MATSSAPLGFVGFQADSGDSVAFVVLRPILAGSVIHFTDAEWNGSAFGSASASWSWTATADVAAGTRVTMSALGGGGASDIGAVEVSAAGGSGRIGGVSAYTGSSTAPSLLASTRGEAGGGTDIGAAAPLAGGAAPGESAGLGRAESRETATGKGEAAATMRDAFAGVVTATAATLATALQPTSSAPAAAPTFGDGDESYVNDRLLVGGIAMRGGNDTLRNGGSIVSTDGIAIDMGAGNDVVTLLEGSNVFGRILLGDGDDRLTAADGDLIVDAGDGNDVVIGGEGDDLLSGGTGDDTLEGGAGDDALQGGMGADRLVGGEGDDVLLGGDGGDTLIGGAGNDAIDGGSGDDTILIGTQDGLDTIAGGDGLDTVRLNGTDTGTLRATRDVEILDVAGGSWSVAGSAAYGEIAIRSGAALTSQVVVNGDDRVTIGAGGRLAVATNALLWQGGGAATVANAGLVETSGRALETAAGAVGSLRLDNAATGIIKGAITPTTAGAAGAVITFDNAGTIEASVAGRVIDFRAFDGNGAKAIINNLEGGIIRHIGTDNADIVRPGVNGIVNNAGSIVAASGLVGGGDAIDFQNDAGGQVNNRATGRIEGAKHAVTGEKAMTIVNDGVMIGRNGSAVNVDNDGSVESTVRITNRGTMEGRSAETANSDGDAIDVDGLLSLQNNGRVAGLGHEGANGGEPNISEGIAAGGGSISNDFTGTIYGYGRAIQVDNSGNATAFGTTFIRNDGLIQGDGRGPEGVPAADAARFDLRGNEAINLVGDLDDEIINNSQGRIVGGVAMGGGNDRMNNSGAITAIGGSAIDMGAGDDVLTVYVGSRITGEIRLGAGNDRITIGDYIDQAHTIDGGDGDDSITAGFGNDVIRGGAGNDYVFAGQGDDTIDAGDGDDYILADAGNDTIDGGAGFDTLALLRATGPVYVDMGAGRVSAAGIGADTFRNIEKIEFGAGNDQVIGGNGDDTLDGGDGDDRLTGGAGDDTLAGALGGDTLTGGSGDDTLDGGDGADILSGGSGDDVLLGGAGADTMTGGSGDDRLVGGAGDDVMTGGSGRDSFVFAFGGGRDTIRDFDASGADGDVIEFTGDSLDAALSIARQVGGDVVFTLDAQTTLTLADTQLSALSADDFRFA